MEARGFFFIPCLLFNEKGQNGGVLLGKKEEANGGGEKDAGEPKRG